MLGVYCLIFVLCICTNIASIITFRSSFNVRSTAYAFCANGFFARIMQYLFIKITLLNLVRRFHTQLNIVMRISVHIIYCHVSPVAKCFPATSNKRSITRTNLYYSATITIQFARLNTRKNRERYHVKTQEHFKNTLSPSDYHLLSG